MTDTLLFEGYAADGLPSVTIGTSTIYLADDFSFGDVLLSGSLLDRHAPKQWVVPVVVKEGTRAAMRATVEDLMQALSRDYFKLTWTPTGGLAMVFDCYDAQVVSDWSMPLTATGARRLSVTFTTRPYGSTPTTTEAVAGVTGTGTRYFVQTAQNVKGTAPGLVTDLEVAGSNLLSSIIHATPPGRAQNIPIPLTAGASSYVTPNDQDGTYAVWVVYSAVQVGSSLGEFSWTSGYIGGPGFTGAALPILPVATIEHLRSRYCPAGFITLPGIKTLGTPAYQFQCSVTSVGTGVTPLEVLLLNVEGTTVYRSSGSVPTNAIRRNYIKGPDYPAELNEIYEPADQATITRNGSYSRPDYRNQSGGPLTVHPAGSVLMAHSPYSTPTSITATYAPRWLSERTV